jgi:FtsZ-interacting cell division protein ZipA
MKLILIILGVVAVVLNAILWYAKKRAGKTVNAKASAREEKLDRSDTRPREIEGPPDISQLKESAAVELGIAVEELDRMSIDEIVELAEEKGLIGNKQNG